MYVGGRDEESEKANRETRAGGGTWQSAGITGTRSSLCSHPQCAPVATNPIPLENHSTPLSDHKPTPVPSPYTSLYATNQFCPQTHGWTSLSRTSTTYCRRLIHWLTSGRSRRTRLAQLRLTVCHFARTDHYEIASQEKDGSTDAKTS